MSDAFTFYFEDIFHDYDTWKSVMEEYSTIDYTKTEEAAFDQFCFKLLFRHYNHANIRYDTPDAFVSELLNVYENKFKQFMTEKRIIDKMSDLTLDELQIVSTTLTNMANNPNDDVSDPLQPLNYISAQTFNQVQSNKLRAYLEALNNIPTLEIYKFFKANTPQEMGFDDLFMSVQPNSKYVYSKGEY